MGRCNGSLFNPEGEVNIGVVGKYVGLPDAYKSLNEALIHGGLANRVKVNVKWIDAEIFEGDDKELAVKLDPLRQNFSSRRIWRTW